MEYSHLFIDAGMMTPEKVIAMMLDFERSKKEEGGGERMPAADLADWLNAKEESVQ